MPQGSPDRSDVEIDTATYRRCVAAFSMLERHLGINIKLHGASGEPEAELDAADILALNHFARFETIIPGYLVYKATGRYCRTLAAAELFRGSSAFRRFLTSIGGVPNDMEGVLAFLAAEILRGRKVVIFPEGGMIKDRRVTDDDGEIRIISPSSGKARKHHTGAAAVALVLEIFKERIRSVSAAGDTDRLRRWADALGLEDVEVLVKRASRPTRIVPANITFHPIRAEENILTKGADRLFRAIAADVREELLVEGNLLLRDTDMDIRLAQPSSPDIKWSWWERQLLAWSFGQIQSLDHLFDLSASPNGFIDRLASTLVHHNIRRLRDRCMLDMYRHTTINIAHLASRLLLRLHGNGVTSLPMTELQSRLYRAIKAVQVEDGLFLHRSLIDPERYEGLLDGSCAALEQLLATASAAGLLRIEEGELELLDPLGSTERSETARVDHVVRVYANELAPLESATTIVDAVAEASEEADPLDIADHLFDDEVRCHRFWRQRFDKPHHAHIHDQETATASGAPYLLEPDEPRETGVLLVHGFLASPAELRGLGELLEKRGFPVMAPRLRGHGTSPLDLETRTSDEWLASVRRGHQILQARCRRVVIIGFSMGGVLALRLAAEKPKGLAGVVSVSAPVRLRSRGVHLAPALHGARKLGALVTSMTGLMRFVPSNTAQAEINYQSIPVASLVQLRKAIREAYTRLSDVTCPALLLQGTEDPVVDPKSVELLAKRIGHPSPRVHHVTSDRHGLILENIGDTRVVIADFVEALDDLAGREDETDTSRSQADLYIEATE